MRRLVIISFLLGFFTFQSSLFALEPTDKWEGSINYAATGGSFLLDTCSPDLTGSCMPGSFLDGQGDKIVPTSTASLYGVPDQIHVLRAFLVWMGSVESGVQQPDDSLMVTPPLGDTYPVVAESAQLEEIIFQENDPNFGLEKYHFYTYRVDITEIVRRHVVTEDLPLNGQWTVGGFTGYAENPYVLHTTVLGGWSLVIVYSGADLNPKRVYYYTTFQKIRDEVVTLYPAGFEVPENPEAKVTFFLGEGDQNILGMGTGTHNEELRFNGVTLTDFCNTANNAYNSTVNTNISPGEQPCRINQYSIDLDTFDISPFLGTGDTGAEVRLSLGQDQVFINYLILSIDTKLPDFDIPNAPEKTASVPAGSALYPGQEFTYYIAVQNNGEDRAENVIVRDPLPSDVTYIPGTTVVVEPDGTRREIPDLAGGQTAALTGIPIADEMPPGATYKRIVEIGVRLNTLEEGITKETIIQNTGEIISGNGDTYFTNGGVPVQHTVQLEAFEGTLHIDKGPRHPSGRYVHQGDTDVPIAHMAIKAIGGGIQISSLRFDPVDDNAAILIKQASLYLDKNRDGIANAGDVEVGTPVAFGSTGYLFDDFSALPGLEANEEALLLMVADIDETAEPGSETTLELNESGAAIRGFTEGLPFTCARLAIPTADTDLIVELGYGNPQDGYLTAGTTAPVIQLLLTGYGDGATVNGLSLSAEGTLHEPTELAQVFLARDMNGDGIKQPGDLMIGSAVTIGTDDGTANFTGLNLSLPAGQSSYILVLASIGAETPSDKRFRLNIETNAMIDAGGAIVVGAPIEGSLFTISEEAIIECEQDADCMINGPGWTCDNIEGICKQTGGNFSDGDVTDGDIGNIDGDLGDGDFTQSSPENEDGSGGGCSGATPVGWIMAIALAALLRRKIRFAC